MAALLDKGDDALRFVGTVELWKNVVVSTLIGIGIVVGIVALLRYHSGWRSGTFTATSVTCDPPAKVRQCHDGKCTSKTVTRCPDIRLDGFAQSFVGEYDTSPPTTGSAVRVVYDPTDPSKAELARNDPIDEYKSWIIAGLVLVLAGVTLSAWFQYHVRHSHLAQRVAGGAAVFDMVAGRGF